MRTHKVKSLVTCQAILWTYTANAKGYHSVKLRVTFNREQKYYPVQVDGKKLFLSPAQWEAVTGDRPRGTDNKVLKSEINKVVAAADMAAERITANGRPFTFERFEQEFLQQSGKGGFLLLFERYLQDLKAEGRIGSYLSYQNAYSAFNRFRGGKTKTKDKPFVRGKELRPEELTVPLLKKFDQWLKDQGCNKTTIGIYMRALRIIFNVAIDANPSLAELYPFARKQNDNKRYKIRSGSGKKGDALTLEQIQAFIKTTPEEGTAEWEAKQYFLFMFYCQGMNMADVAALKYRDVQWDAIRYVRQKTKDTEREEKPIEIPITNDIKKILLSIGNPDRSPTGYVFPILSNDMTPERIRATVKQKNKIVNKWLSRLCEDNDLPAITTYWSRHSFASLLKGLGTSVEMISELLGHSDPKTTRAYLQRFDMDQKQKVSDKLTATLKAS